MRQNETKRLVIAALMLALGLVLPFLTMQIPEIGSMMLPMHIPVLLCGFICGWKYGLAVGLITPILRSVIFGMPPMMPTAVGMAVELAVYGCVIAILYKYLKNKKGGIYISLIGAMIVGRVAWGAVSILIYVAMDMKFSWSLFIAGAVVNAIPGIILQLILIPLIMAALRKSSLLG